jgi:hypothetical protein
MAAQGAGGDRPVRPPPPQHADPAHLGHHRHLGAPRADPQSARRPEAGPVGPARCRRPGRRAQGTVADGRAGRAVHQHPGL